MIMRNLTFFVVAGLAFASGCPEEPIAHSGTVSVKLGGMKEGDVKNNELSSDKSLHTEPGDPYGEFVGEATATLGGAPPGRIEVLSAVVRKHSDSTGVNGLEDVLESLEVYLSNNLTTIVIGDVSAPSGSSAEVTLIGADLEALHESMLGGDGIRVGVRGPAAASTPEKFDLRLTVDITFEAYAE